MPETMCEGCGSAGRPKWIEPGIWWVELLLWLLLILPGYAYRLWRRGAARIECLNCGAAMFRTQGNTSKIKPLLLQTSGLVLGTSRTDGVDRAAASFSALLTKSGIDITAKEAGIFSSPEHQAWFPFSDETTFEVMDTGRSAGKAVAGAALGALLVGPLGLLVGAALGGRKTHVVAASNGEDSAVLQVTPAQLQTLKVRGVLR